MSSDANGLVQEVPFEGADPLLRTIFDEVLALPGAELGLI